MLAAATSALHDIDEISAALGNSRCRRVCDFDEICVEQIEECPFRPNLHGSDVAVRPTPPCRSYVCKPKPNPCVPNPCFFVGPDCVPDPKVCDGNAMARCPQYKCVTKNPCVQNPCLKGYRCVPTPRVCTTQQTRCRQYNCVRLLVESVEQPNLVVH